MASKMGREWIHLNCLRVGMLWDSTIAFHRKGAGVIAEREGYCYRGDLLFSRGGGRSGVGVGAPTSTD